MSRRTGSPGCDAYLRLRGAPRSVVPILRAASGRVSEQITVRIQQEITPYAGPLGGRRGKLIREAVERAVTDFIDLTAEQSHGHAGVGQLFWELGYAEGAAGLSLGPLRSAIQLAWPAVWNAFQRVAQQHSLSGGTVASLGEGLDGYLRHLTDHAERGYLAARAETSSPRVRLITALITGGRSEAVRELAAEVGWTVPDEVVVMVVELPGAVRAPRLPDRTLAHLDGGRLVVVAAAHDLEWAREEVGRATGSAPIAVSWPVRPSEASDAYRWARRALWLRREGRLPSAGRVMDCAEYRLSLLLQADPPLVAQLGVDLLAPLSSSKPHYRLMLAETLLRWLETDENAPALARRLGVHAQTVRHRIRALRELFGDRLHDPEQRMALILVLEATVPLWRAHPAARD